MNNTIYVLIEENNYLNGYIVTKDEFQKYLNEADTDQLNYIIAIYDLKATGKTYQEKKEYIRTIAKDYSCADNGNNNPDELQVIYNFFEENGRRYGLLTEFKENWII